MKRKLLSIVICLALVASFFTCFTTSVSAAPSDTLEVYVQRGSGTPVLLHTYTQAEIMALPTVTQYYTAIDSLPTYTQSKGQGVTLTTLANDAKQYDTYHNVAFGPGDSFYMRSTDSWNRTFYYDNDGTTGTSKFYGLGSTRYYYPNAYTDNNGDFNHDTSGAVPVQPFLAVNSVWSRSITRVNDFHDGKSFENVPLGTIVTQSVLDTEFTRAVNANQTPDDFTRANYRAFRIAFGLTPDEIENDMATAPAHGYWGYTVRFMMPAYDVTVGSVNGGTVTSDAPGTGASAGDTVTLTVAPSSGKQLSALTASYSGGQTLSLNSGAGNTFTFTMPAYAVTINAQFEDAPTSTVTFNSQGGSPVSSLTNVASGSTITAPTAPTKTGYTFGGWYKEAGCTTAWNFSTDTVTSNITLYARWTATSSAPAWDLNGDHLCNILDVGKIGSKWGWTGTAGSIPEDLNHDGLVNILDVGVIGSHWGQNW